MKTIEALQAGRSSYKYVVLIEGVSGYVLSDAPQAACQTALAGTDWASATRVEAFIELQNEQKLQLWNPFTTNGTCKVRVYDPTDAFATFVNKRLSGAQTEMTQTHDRNDTTFNVKGTTGFPASGTAYVGTETFTYSGITSSSFTGVTRGIASPFGCDSTGSGGSRFGNHHRLGSSVNHTQAAPLITQLPRVWIGRRVGVFLCTWSQSTLALNAKADWQLVYAGRVASIGDDPQTFHTVFDLEHLAETDIKNVSIGRDLFKGEIAPGLTLITGRVFGFKDRKGGAWRTANALTVVSGTPVSVNEIQAGQYTAGELCDRFNAWLGSELNAARLYGHYNWASPVALNDGLRTICRWKIVDASTIEAEWRFSMPCEVGAFLGLQAFDFDLRGQTISQNHKGTTNENHVRRGSGAPYETLMFYPGGPGRIAQEFSEAINYDIANPTGNFYDQYDLMSYAVKGATDSSLEWGIFLFDERILIVGAYDASSATAPILKNCWIAPFQFAAAKTADAAPFIGRRLDEPESGPVIVRQILVLEQNWAQLLLRLAYSTGTSGYNHSTYDTLPYGCGWNLPGSLLGPEFERSLLNLPGADMPQVVVIDEATTFGELFKDDFLFRWSFVCWRDQGFEIGEWKTPVASLAATSYAGVTLELVEANKADADPNAEHRIASIESNEHIRPVVRVEYARDFGSDRNARYTKALQIEDQRAVDDAGGNVRPQTIRLRHTFAELAATGSAVEKLKAGFITRVTMASKAARKIVRTADLRYWEGYTVGQIALSSDSYARDPITGRRSIASRPAMITRLAYSPGGPPWNKGKSRDPFCEMELMFLDVQRGQNYAPCAQVDVTQANAGYNAALRRLICFPHAYSHSLLSLGLRRGGTTDDIEAVDASHFPAGSKIHIIEIDPANPAAPIEWERTVESQSGDNIILTVALSAPAWDATKEYRIVPQKYSQVIAAQQEVVYQADDDDCMVEDLDPPWDFSHGGRGISFTDVTNGEPGEFIPAVAYGDGRPLDPGHEHAIGFTLNAYHDGKSLHQSPAMAWAGPQIGGVIGTGDWHIVSIRSVFLGLEHLSSTVKREFLVAPFFASSTGSTASVRITIGRTMPTETAGDSTGVGQYFQNPRFNSEFSQSTVWTTTSTTFQMGDDATLELNCKDLGNGCVILIVEAMGDTVIYGAPKCYETGRVVG